MSFILGTTKDKAEEQMLRHLTFVVMQIEIQSRVGLCRKMLHQKIPLSWQFFKGMAGFLALLSSKQAVKSSSLL